MSTLPSTGLFAIPLPVVAIIGMICCVVLKYACCCTKKAQQSRRERIRKSRRSRGRFGSETPGPVEVKVIPAEFESPKQALVDADTNSGVYTGPPCTDDAPPPYPQEPPPSYHQSVDTSTSPSSDQSGDPVDHGESN